MSSGADMDSAEAPDDPNDEWVRPKGMNSFVWDHFTQNKVKKLAKCDHCGKEYKVFGSTTNMKNHLANKHFIKEPAKEKSSQKGQPLIGDAMAREIVSMSLETM